MKKLLFNPLFFCSLHSFAFADYTNVLPQNVVLQSGQTQTHNAILYAANQYYTFGNTGSTASGNSFSISTNGSNRATFTLNATKPSSGSKPTNDYSSFYIGASNITNTNVNFSNFDEFTFTTGQTTLNNASLNLNLGSARSKTIGLIGNAKLSLNNSSFTSNAATLQLSKVGNEINATDSTINLQSTKVNNYGTIVLNNTTAQFGNVINIGKESSVTGDSPAVSSFINNGGNVTINGNFDNGGFSSNASAQYCIALGTCGGGSLENLNGATTTITGNLISKGEGGKDSLINIQGGTIKVNGSVSNEAGSTLNFGAYNGIMGKLEATSFTNSGGKIQIDISGVKEGSFTFLSSNITSLNASDISIYGSNEFVSIDMNQLLQGKINITFNQNNMNNFQDTLNANERSIFNALDSTMSNIWSMGDSTSIRGVIGGIEKGLFAGYITMPFIFFDSMKQNKEFYGIENALNVGMYGGGIASSEFGYGGITGLYVNKNFDTEYNKLSVQLHYGYANNTQNLAYHELKEYGNLIMLSLADRIIIDKIEVDLALYGGIGFFNSTRKSTGLSQTLNALGNFNVYQLNLDSQVGYRFTFDSFDSFSLKPFAGFNQYINIQGSFQESGDVRIYSDSYTNYLLNFLVGLEMRYMFNNEHYLFTKIGYEIMLASSQKALKLNIENNPLSFDMQSFQKISVNIGGRVALNDNMSLIVDGFYKNLFVSAHTFGANVMFGYTF